MQTDKEKRSPETGQMVNLKEIIGVYPICNTGAVLVHAIDYGEDRVLASINGIDPEWCEMTEQYTEAAGELELGFYLGSFFVPFAEIMRFHGGG